MREVTIVHGDESSRIEPGLTTMGQFVNVIPAQAAGLSGSDGSENPVTCRRSRLRNSAVLSVDRRTGEHEDFGELHHRHRQERVRGAVDVLEVFVVVLERHCDGIALGVTVERRLPHEPRPTAAVLVDDDVHVTGAAGLFVEDPVRQERAALVVEVDGQGEVADAGVVELPRESAVDLRAAAAPIRVVAVEQPHHRR